MHTAHPDFQFLLAFALFSLAAGGPIWWVRRQYQRHSFMYQRPWRATAVLIAAAVLVLPVGFAATLLISFPFEVIGWRVFHGDHGFMALFALLWAAALLALAGIITGMLTLTGKLPKVPMADGAGGQPPGGAGAEDEQGMDSDGGPGRPPASR